MTDRFDPGLVDAFLDHHWSLHPVDATFMGARGFDGRLPPAGPDTMARERAEAQALLDAAEAADEPGDLGLRLDRRMMIAELRRRLAPAGRHHRFANPAWFTGEAAFGVVSLLLPAAEPVRHAALLSRLSGIPAFLEEGRERLDGRAVPSGWVARAHREAAATAAFLRGDVRLHESFDRGWEGPAAAAADAFETFADGLDGVPDADPACGKAALWFIMREVHGLAVSPREAADLAQAAFDRLGRECDAMARAIAPGRTAADVLRDLADAGPADPEGAIASYRDWDRRALAAGDALVTPARDYGLDYRWLAPCFRALARALYFLSYRSPPGLDPGAGSIYWVPPPATGDEAAFLRASATATVKTMHAAHHGSIGHHTQNSRARLSPSRLARIAGTDCALGLAFPGAGTLVEGWACHAVDLLAEAPDFYGLEEALLLKQGERRNAASVLVDVKLHLGDWTPAQAEVFYRDEAGFPPARVEAEVVRNAMLPGSRLMYWFGVEGVRRLRRRWTGDTRSFHDALLGYGHVPLAWIGEEMERAGLVS